jgi:hypothetical protein
MLILQKQLLPVQKNGHRTSSDPVRGIGRSVGFDCVKTALPWVCHVNGRPDVGSYCVIFIEDILRLDVAMEDLEPVQVREMLHYQNTQPIKLYVVSISFLSE